MARPPQAVQRSPWLVLLTVVVVVGLWWFTASEDEPATPGNGSTGAGAQQTAGATSTPTDSASSATPSVERSVRPGSPSSAPSVTATPKEPSRAASPTPSPSRGDASPRAPTAPAVDEDGLAWVDADDLPHPAQNVLAAIDAGGPFAHAPKDGSTFGNYEGVLPQRKRGYYREYTVDTPGVNHRGARRIVTGNGGELYWTADHYASFSRIRR